MVFHMFLLSSSPHELTVEIWSLEVCNGRPTLHITTPRLKKRRGNVRTQSQLTMPLKGCVGDVTLRFNLSFVCVSSVGVEMQLAASEVTPLLGQLSRSDVGGRGSFTASMQA
jgi:hypothetical protein